MPEAAHRTKRAKAQVAEATEPRGAESPAAEPHAALAGLIRDVSWVVFDTETTGFGPDAHLVELAAVRLSPAFEVVGAFASLVRPPLSIPSDASAVHGITDEHVARSPSSGEVIPAFLEFSKGAVLVAHNAGFDRAILLGESARSAGPALDLDEAVEVVVDTLKLARWAFPGLESYTLGNLRDVLDLDGWMLPDGPNGPVGLAHLEELIREAGRSAHRALPDALATAKLLARVLEVVPGLAAGTLGDLLALPSPSAAPRTPETPPSDRKETGENADPNQGELWPVAPAEAPTAAAPAEPTGRGGEQMFLFSPSPES